MRKMKDSGIAWIGEIPEDWEFKRLKYTLDSHFGGSWGSLPEEDEIDTICIRVADFNYPKLRIRFSEDMTIRSYNKNVIESLSINNGDILLEKSGGGEITPVGRSVLFENNESLMCANFIECLRINNKYDCRFVNYWLHSSYINGYSKRNIKQTTGIQNLDIQSLLDETIVSLSMQEQNRIVNYLDNRCSEIDTVIDAKETTNEKLKEYRQSIIYEAVTKGLDKNVPMKDSGIEWIGEIPEGWTVEKLKYHADYNPVINTSIFDLEDEVSFIPMENLKNGYHETSIELFLKVKKGYVQFNNGDIIIAKVTPCFENGNIAIANNLINGIGFGSTEINVIRCKTIETRYVFYYLQSRQFIERAKSDMYGVAGLKRLIPSFIPDSYYPIPSKEEQKQIADYLDKKCAEINSVISANEKTIEKLKEYRQSVIYEAVTGKTEIV